VRPLFIFIIATLSFVSCGKKEEKKTAQDQNQLSTDLIKNPNSLSDSSQKLPELTFETTEHDFGKLKEGDKVEYEFRFTNTGEAPLLISEVKAACGCTTPYWPKGLIKSGEANVIRVVYNSQGHPGEFNKGIVVTANTYPNQSILKISGVVFKK
jgi:hypothetical protein